MSEWKDKNISSRGRNGQSFQSIAEELFDLIDFYDWSEEDRMYMMGYVAACQGMSKYPWIATDGEDLSIGELGFKDGQKDEEWLNRRFSGDSG